jgi:PAS domain S-box-containing protein
MQNVEPDNGAAITALGEQLFEISPDCVKLLDADGRVAAINANGRRMMEIDDEITVIGLPWKALWPANSHADIDAATGAARRGGTGFFRAICPTAKGTPKWWDVTVSPLRGADESIGTLLVVSRDVTGTQDTIAELRASEARFRSLVVATSAIVWNTSASGDFDTEQTGWAAFTGQTFAQYAGRGWLNAVHPDDRPRTEAMWQRAIAAGAVCQLEHRVRRPDGQYRYMSVRMVPIAGSAGQVDEWVGVHTDVTAAVEASAERERLLKEVQAANDRLADIFRQAPAFMCVLRGPEHVFEMVNERYLDLVGQRDVLGLPFRHALPDLEGQGFFEIMDRVYRSGEPYIGIDMPVRLRRSAQAAPEQRYVDYVFMALRDADGRVEGLLAHGVDQTHRKQSEIAQQENRDRLLLATGAAELGLWSWSPAEDKLVWENPRAYDIIGVSPTDEPVSMARFVEQCIDPDDAHALQLAMLATIRSGDRLSFQSRLRRADGQLRWIEFFGHVQLSREGGPLQIIGTTSDITARKLAEIDLVESREQFKKIVSQAATGVLQADADARITLVNQCYCDMLGYAEDELLGKRLVDLVAPESVESTLHALDRVAGDAPGFVLDQQYPRNNGSLLLASCNVNALRGPDGAHQGVVAVVVDITERRRAEQELRASEERYRTLFESMDQGYCIIDMIFDAHDVPVDYRFLEMNPVFATHTGLVDAIDKTARELVPELDDFWFQTYGRVASTGEPVRFESEAKAMERWFDVYATRIGDARSRKVALLFNDITHRKQAEDKLRRLAANLAEEDRRKTEFLATLAHELRNPLAPIRSGLGIMKLSKDNPAALTKVREMMDRQVTQMVRLIDDLLDIARIAGGKIQLKMEQIELNQVLSSAVETSLPLIEAARHELSMDLASGPLLVTADADRLSQVVANLLNNAAKYTPPGGRITLAVRREHDSVAISVTDNGLGIPAESLATVFDMFSQVGRHIGRAQGGLGIGLSLVRQFVEMHHGSVTVHSDGPGAGSTFTVRLPLVDAGAPPVSVADRHTPSAEGPKARKLNVLVVDDNIDAAQMLAMMIDIDGHLTRIATDGLAAIEAMNEFRPDIVFLDIGMPGMNGYETAEAIRRTPGWERVILTALTGWGTDGDRARAREAGFDHHLTKPVGIAAIHALLAEIAELPAPLPAPLRIVQN